MQRRYLETFVTGSVRENADLDISLLVDQEGRRNEAGCPKVDFRLSA